MRAKPSWMCEPARLAASALVVLVALGSAAAAEPKVEFERWYSVLLQEQPAGWMHSRVTREQDRIVTQEELAITVRRGPDSLTLESRSRFVETAEGRPVEAESGRKLGASELVQTLRFGEQGMELVAGRGAQARRSLLPRPEQKWLTPAGARRHVEEEIARGAKEIRFWTLDPSDGPQVYEVSMKLVGAESAEVFGKAVPALVWETRSSLLPGISEREYTDTHGETIRSTLPLLPGTALTVVEADRELALARKSPPELLAATLIVPTGRIAEPRRLVSAVYEIRRAPVEGAAGPGSPAPIDLPQQGYQRTARSDRGGVRVVVDLSSPVDPGEEVPTQETLGPSALVDSADPEVQRLLGEALPNGSGRDPARAAETLRRFVHGYIKGTDLSVGLASAGEVARTAQGDCTEYAVLLAALLRAAGIPSRVASGLLYVERFLGREGVFGYHMWTQAWIPVGDRKARWIDLDATLGEAPFDAGHIALGASALADGSMVNDLVKLAPLIGRLSVDVVETKTGGAP